VADSFHSSHPRYGGIKRTAVTRWMEQSDRPSDIPKQQFLGLYARMCVLVTRVTHAAYACTSKHVLCESDASSLCPANFRSDMCGCAGRHRPI